MDPSDDEVFQDLIPEPVRTAYAEELVFIAQKVALRVKGIWYIDGLQLLPYIGDALALQDIDVASACSDEPRDHRTDVIVKKIEAGLNFKLDDETKKNIRLDVEQMYLGRVKK